jgi:hypothetical protein
VGEYWSTLRFQMAFKAQSGPSDQCEVFLAGSAPLRNWRLIFTKLVVVLLVVGLATLATLAKDGQYYPATNAARHVSLSTKMNVTHAPVVFDRGALKNVAQLVSPKPRPVVTRRTESEPLTIESVGVVVSLQHRSPPAVLS